MAREIFISYSRDDKAVVHPFVQYINDAMGWESCWIDLEDIEIGEEFEEGIMQAIDECRVVLFMLSDNSLKSKWTKREVFYAEKHKKQIWPVIVDGDDLRGWFDFHFNIVDHICLNNKDDRAKLVKKLKRRLKVQEDNVSEDEANRKVVEENAESNIEEAEWKILEELDNYVLRPIVVKGKYGFVNTPGKVAIPCKWDYAEPFSEGLALVKNEHGKYGFIDKLGKVVIPCKWDAVWSFSEGLAAIENERGKRGYIDKTGKVVIPCYWKFARPFSEGLAAVANEQRKWGYINKTGRAVIPCQWKDAKLFSGDLARVKNEQGKWLYIDKSGVVVTK